MQVIEGRNINQIWPRAVPLLRAVGEKSASRAGNVLVAPYPVMSVTHQPMERVLFDPARDANPFFHLFECLWLMAGRSDAEFLNIFVRDFGQRFAEPHNGQLYGAYGKRWRGHWHFDQLDVAVRRLSENNDDRRTVIAMWDPSYDLQDPDERDPESGEPRDLPCNTQIYLRVRRATIGVGYERTVELPMLDMTVCCRSNDIVWGAYGANAVHFSFLQEYLAGRIGVQVGTLYQLSNNWHAYVDVLDRLDAKVDHTTKLFTPEPYTGGEVVPMPIGEQWSAWDDDLREFLRWTVDPLARGTRVIVNQWFETVAKPMWKAHAAHRLHDPIAALAFTNDVAASDWSRAAHQWLGRRQAKKEAA